MKIIITVLLLIFSVHSYMIESETDPPEIEYSQLISFEALENPKVSVAYGKEKIEGILLGMEKDSVLLKIEQKSDLPIFNKVELNKIDRISKLRKSQLGYFLMGGLASGLATGYLIGYSTGKKNPTLGGWSRSTGAGIGASIGAAIGGSLGALIGLFTGIDKDYDLSSMHY